MRSPRDRDYRYPVHLRDHPAVVVTLASAYIPTRSERKFHNHFCCVTGTNISLAYCIDLYEVLICLAMNANVTNVTKMKKNLKFASADFVLQALNVPQLVFGRGAASVPTGGT